MKNYVKVALTLVIGLMAGQEAYAAYDYHTLYEGDDQKVALMDAIENKFGPNNFKLLLRYDGLSEAIISKEIGTAENKALVKNLRTQRDALVESQKGIEGSYNRPLPK